jgi:hypothetical protein
MVAQISRSLLEMRLKSQFEGRFQFFNGKAIGKITANSLAGRICAQ